MGLDISAYRQIKLIPGADYENQDGHYIGATPPDFASRAEGIEPGYYEAAEVHGFAAGSYSGYGAWREELARLAGYPKHMHFSAFKPEREMHAAGAWDASEGPFWELINFSDCEGVIGPRTAAKLAKDFAEYQPRVDTHHDSWFRDRYAQWRKAFEIASDSGAVHFH